jgi:hypothetical protein
MRPSAAAIRTNRAARRTPRLYVCKLGRGICPHARPGGRHAELAGQRSGQATRARRRRIGVSAAGTTSVGPGRARARRPPPARVTRAAEFLGGSRSTQYQLVAAGRYGSRGAGSSGWHQGSRSRRLAATCWQSRVTRLAAQRPARERCGGRACGRRRREHPARGSGSSAARSSEIPSATPSCDRRVPARERSRADKGGDERARDTTRGSP